MLKTVSSITNAIGALNFKGTWDANANSPALASSVGTKGDYYVVGTAGSTNLNGISNWGVGDLATFNGSVWQRVEGGADLNGVNLTVTNTTTLSGLTASTALALDASKNVVSVANTGTGDNVLATSPTLVTPVLGTPSSGTVTNLTGTASININGTVGATTPATGSFTTLAASSPASFAAGTAALPSITRTGDTNTGIFFPAADTIAFAEGGAEAMRIDSAGNLLVGTTGAFLSTNTFFKDAGAGQPVLSLVKNSTANTDQAFCILNGLAGGTVSFQVLANGNAQNTNNSYGAISDVKLKENVTDATPKLDKLNQVRIVNYNLKTNPNQKLLGVIAQELEQIFPGMVEESSDRDKDGNDLGTTTKSVKYSVFVPMLIKAIQEQQAIIESLTARVAQLESN